jgi:predicted phage baseplate assembly protein
MPLTAPNLDNLDFDEIVAQAKTLIPRYAPEWTNYNETDPGITLVELFAWMTEILIYRLNQTPDQNYIKFLQLLGIQLQAAQPAHTELTFSVTRPDLVSVIVPLGTQVAAQGSDGGPPIVFETDQALIAIGAVLDAVQSFDGISYSVLTSRNANAGQWFYPFGQNVKLGSALLLGFTSPSDFAADQINLAVSLHQDLLSRPLLQCGASIPPPATLVWEFWNGTAWSAINLDSDGTRAFTQDGHILFPGPGANAQRVQIGNVADPRYWIRARVQAASYEMSPQLAAIRTNTISATQAITFTDEVLGGSDGTPNQQFLVTNTPVVALSSPMAVTNTDGTRVNITSVRLEVDEGLGFIAWQQVDDFYSANAISMVFTFDRNTGIATFGDGEHGRIPAANPANASGNVVARWYRAGGSSMGNVGALTITQLLTNAPSISTAVNYEAATGGTDEETVANAKLRASLALQSRNRAVTGDDFVYLATQAPGANVARAFALALYHPDFPNGQVPGVVTVIVVPGSDAPNPSPNQTTLKAVCAYLDTHRLLTSEVYVMGPVYRKVKISAQIVATNSADLATVKNLILAKLTEFFHPLRGGNDGTGWPFGGTMYYSDVYRTIININGVQRVQDNQLLIYLDGQLQTFCRDVAINPGELLYSDPQGHDIQVFYNPS